MKSHLRAVAESALTLFYPRRCPVCDEPVKPWNALICKGCAHLPVYTEPPFCMKCGKHLSSGEKEYCKDCARHSHLFDRGRALFDYKSVSASLARFKYAGRREYAAFYASCMAAHLGGFIRDCGAQALVPVPLHKSRQRRRGYNQAEALARELSALTGIPVMADWIVRIEKTAPMKDLSARERENNLKRAFKIRKNDVKLSTVIIIDDIYTTGSTVDAVSRELKKVGVQRIYFLTLAIGKGA
ncbi:MAG: ComF family protein [Bacteroidales bacterium]|nr:ComF family protein [Bacteroidales bacterium]MCM1415849.1 ComF family protein [bacterium]MCM1423159.1 ComF family protein [bacterium]